MEENETTKNQVKGINANQMSKRILEREDNIYKFEVVSKIIKMYEDEVYKAILNGERVQLSGVGTIIPEIKVHKEAYHIPWLNKEGGNPPATNIRFRRNNKFVEAMNAHIRGNIRKGILGLGEKCMCTAMQIRILKDSGYLKAECEEWEDEDE